MSPSNSAMRRAEQDMSRRANGNTVNSVYLDSPFLARHAIAYYRSSTSLGATEGHTSFRCVPPRYIVDIHHHRRQPLADELR